MDDRFVVAHGARIPKIALGTWQAVDEAGEQAVATALRAGYQGIDTATRYGNEEAVGRGLKASGVARDDYFLTTKVWYTDLAADDLQRSAEASLRRLDLDVVDLLLIHWPNRDIPLAETVKALCAVKRRGLTRHIGVSNFPIALLDEAVALADEPLAANQCESHPLIDQSRLKAACARHGMAFISYAPLGSGKLGEHEVIARLADKYGKTPAQIILRWHIQQTGVTAIPKSVTPERIRQNLEVFDFVLDDDDMAQVFGLARPDGRLFSPEWAARWDN